MPMVMIFILRQDRNYADYFVPNTRKSLKLPRAIDVFFVFGATFEFLMFNRRTQPSTGPLLCILFGIAQPRNWFFALSVSDSKIS